MARLYADEDFPLETVEALRRRGHDVATTSDLGQANQAIPDADVLAYARSLGRALLTLNRWDFVRLHSIDHDHCGIIVCSPEADAEAQAARIEAMLGTGLELGAALVRVNRPGR